jgi:Xaa-Pro aminopeptidase
LLSGAFRFSGGEWRDVLGYVAFSESGLYPTSFDGPGGTNGTSFATPFLGSTTRRLRKGDMVLVDFGFGCQGYSTDKTALYSFGGKPDAIVQETFQQCAELMWRTAEIMNPGAVPAEIL